MIKITLTKRQKDNVTKVSTLALERFVERIKTDTKGGAVTRRRRSLELGGDLESYDRIYPPRMVYPHAEFDKDESDNLTMKSFNGIVTLTIDGLESQADIDEVKRAARMLPSTLAAFCGATGHEVITMVRISRADDENMSQMTEEEANKLCQQGGEVAMRLYQSIIPRTIRGEKFSVHSNFCMPLDPCPYYNTKAIALPIEEKPLNLPEKEVEAKNDDSIDDNEAVEVTKREQKLVNYLKTHYRLRYNSIMGYTECWNNDKKYPDWTPVDTRVLNGMAVKVKTAGINASSHDVRNYVQSDLIKNYDPIGDYLMNVSDKWDGKDHIRQLAKRVPTDNPYWQDWFYTWFLGMVHQWQTSNLAMYGNQTVPLLISKQGWNKSTFCRLLLPPELSWGYTQNLQINDKRQVLQQMSQMMLINLDEFNQISPKIQQGFLKNIISLSSLKIKRPYGRHVEDFPRRASFIATTNQSDVLADPSGSRRFLGVELTGPINTSKKINYEQLYAQAMHALRQHEPYYFDEKRTQEIIEYNTRFDVKSEAEQYFYDFFEPTNDEAQGQWMTPTAIMAYLKKKVGVSLLKNTSVNGFGRKLTNMPGIKKKMSNQAALYLVKTILRE